MVRDDCKLPDDSGEVSKPNTVVGNSIPSREIMSLDGKKLTRWSSASCVPKIYIQPIACYDLWVLFY